MIGKGDKLPSATFTVMGTDGPARKTTEEIFGGRRVALFALVGAFTGSCTNNHVPGYLQALDKLKAKGIDAVACLSVNDVFVLNALAKQTGAEGKIEFLADGSAEFTKAAGLDMDLTERGMGVRSKRYALIARDGVVEEIMVEDVPSKVENSSAESVLSRL